MAKHSHILHQISHRLAVIVAFFSLATGCGTRGQKDPRDGRPPGDIPLAPFILSATSRDGYAATTWNTMAYANSYNVYWSTTPGVTTASNKISGMVPPFNFGGLLNGTTYYMKISSVGLKGESALTSELTLNPVNGTGTGDTLFADQWHLDNTGQAGGTATEDINVDSVWASCAGGTTCRGEGVRIAIVDDGIEIAHEDLLANIVPGKSYNYLTGTSDPSYAGSSGGHGHMCAGIAAARDLNDLGVRGVAPRANLVGYNVLENFTSANEADSMVRNASEVSVSSNSWGATDGYGDLAASSTTWKAAIQTGLTTGRNGLGTVYVWAAGNGHGGAIIPARDNSNHDGQANYRGVMAIGALLDSGVKATYSERGANLWLSAPAGNFCSSGHTITTTDRTGEKGTNTAATTNPDYADRAYTKCMNGTSAATPVVAGAAALVIQAKPTLGWRDVRVILATTARQNDPADGEWATNGAGIQYNPNYGFGVVDVQSAVTAAGAYGANLGTELTLTTPLQVAAAPIPDNDLVGVTSDIVVAGSGITKIEFIEVTFSAPDHAAMEDLEVMLTNTSTASSAQSLLTEYHSCIDTDCIPYDGWVFGDTFHLNEPADGTWRLTVKDKNAGTTGTFQSWRLKFYGT